MADTFSMSTRSAHPSALINGSGNHFVAKLLALAAILRIACASVPGIMLRDDAAYYVEAATHLAQGDGYLLHGHATAYWPVGYPSFLSLFMHSPEPGLWFARLVQCALSVLGIYLAYRIALLVWKADAPARLTAVLLACLPVEVFYPALMLSEVLFTTLVLAACFTLLQSSRPAALVMGGVLFGVATLVRPVVTLVPAIVLLLDRSLPVPRRFAHVLLVTLVMLLVATPWALRNQRTFHRPAWVSTNGGVNAWMGHNDEASGTYVLTEEIRLAAQRIPNEAEFDHYAWRRALDYSQHHPVRTLHLMARKVAILWSFDHVSGDTVFPVTRSWQRKASAIVTDLGYLCLWIIFAYSLVRTRRTRQVPVLPLAIVVYFTALYAVTLALPRYQFPALPWIAILAAGAVVKPHAEGGRKVTGTAGGVIPLGGLGAHR